MTARPIGVALASLMAASCARNPPPPSPAMPTAAVQLDAPRRTPAARRPATPAASAVQPAEAEKSTIVQLGSVWAGEDRQEVVRQIEILLERGRRNLATLEAKKTSTKQSRNRQRVRSLLDGALQAQQRGDLLAARELAHRADVLARDLLED